MRKFVILLLVLALLFAAACNKKKKPVLPPHSLAPTLAVALPDEIPEAPEEPAPVVARAPVEPPPVKTKSKKRQRTSAKKNTPPPSTPASPLANGSQTVAGMRPPGNPASELPPDMAIAAAMPSEAIIKQKEDTAKIVDSTENSLKNLSRQLSNDEKTLRSQIEAYLQQSRKATTDGDFERAYNLAKKAQLLAEALIKK